MKRENLCGWICMILLICISTPSKAQNLQDIWGSIKDGVSKVVNNVTTKDNTIVGTWKYESPACKFKSDNLLAQAGGTIASNKVENELADACNKLKITSENTSFQFNEDGSYIQTIAGKESSGTYTFDKENLTVVMKGKLGFSMTAYVKFSGNTMTLVYDADRVWDLAKGIASVASKFMDNNLLTLFNSVSDNYEGMQLGFKLQK